MPKSDWANIVHFEKIKYNGGTFMAKKFRADVLEKSRGEVIAEELEEDPEIIRELIET